MPAGKGSDLIMDIDKNIIDEKNLEKLKELNNKKAKNINKKGY